MGVFDTIKCEYPLPHEEVQSLSFQTKSLNPSMDSYTITEEGRLIWHTPWKEDIDIFYHGNVKLYRTLAGVWYEYLATFVEGQAQQIKLTGKCKKTLAQLQQMSGSPIEVVIKRIVYDDL